MPDKVLTLKVTEKGCVGLYGVRRMPIVFYAQEWDIIFDMKEKILQFIEDNQDDLSFK